MYIVTLQNGELSTVIHGDKERLYGGKIVKGINTIDSFTFSMLPSNAGMGLTNEFTTRVNVYNTSRERYEFVGRVLYPVMSMDESGLIIVDVTCESVLGYLCDSQQPYVDTRNWTVEELFRYLIDTHNAQVEDYKRFVVGNITVTDKNDNLYLGIQRENTWDAIKSNIIDKIGGELQYRVEDDVIYIDYLEKVGETKTTEIALSQNMKAITKERNPTEFITRLYPYGCKLSVDVEKTDEEGNTTTESVETEERLTIAEVNNGLTYIDDVEAQKVYGIISGVQTWDDVTVPGNLLNKGEAWLRENNKAHVKYSITALELSLIGLVLDNLDVGNSHPIKNALLGIDDVARIIKKTIDICGDESQSAIEIGDSFKTLSDIQREQAAEIKAAALNIANLKSEAVNTKNQLNQINKVISESKAFVGVSSTAVYYYLSSSNTERTDGEWVTSPPQWVSGKYYWQKIVTTYTDGSIAESEAVCISGAKGADGVDGINGANGTDGADGVSVTSVATLFYMSESKSDQIGGEWVNSMPTWAKGKYLWTKSVITYSDGTTSETAPICDSTWEAVNELESKLTETFTSQIKQLEDSISLEVNGSLGSNASIILSAGANKYTGEFDLSAVREAFANDNTSVSISGGVITFNAGTLVINSTNFSVSSTGDIWAVSGTIGALNLAKTGIYSCNTSYSNSYAGWYRPSTLTTSTVCFFAGATDSSGSNAPFSVTYGGAIKATSGTIGAITLSSSGIYSYNATVSGSYAGWYRPSTIADTSKCFFAGATSASGASATFSVTYGGQLTATDAILSGEITSTKGTIGAISLSSTGIYSYNSSFSGSHAGWYRPESISTGDICFFAGATSASGTNASFSVTYGGVLTATNATISGTIISESGDYKTILGDGGLEFYYQDVLCATIATRYYSWLGLAIHIEEAGRTFMISHADDSAAGYRIDYYLNYNPAAQLYSEMHIFQTSARFLDSVVFQGTITFTSTVNFNYVQYTKGHLYVYEGSYIKSCDSNKSTVSEMLGHSGNYIYLSDNNHTTILRGSSVLLKNTGGTTVTSDRNAKNTIEPLPDEYEAFIDSLEPVRFKYNNGTSGRYHTGFIAQDVNAALTAAGLNSMDFAGYVDINFSGELGLIYDEFIAVLLKKVKRLEQRIVSLEKITT